MPTGWITTGSLNHKISYNGTEGTKIFEIQESTGQDYPLGYGWQAYNYNIKALTQTVNSQG